jgi:hypothetical protein
LKKAKNANQYAMQIGSWHLDVDSERDSQSRRNEICSRVAGLIGRLTEYRLTKFPYQEEW